MINYMTGAMYQRTRNTYQQLVLPFNNKAMFNEFPNKWNEDVPFNWRMRKGIENKYPTIHSSVGLLKGITRLAWIQYAQSLQKPMTGFGGYAKLKDGGIVAEYWDNVATSFEGLKDYPDSPHIIVKISSNMEVSGVILDQLGKESVYILSSSYQSQSKTHSPCAIAYAQMCAAIMMKEEHKLFADFADMIEDIAKSIGESVFDYEKIPELCAKAYNYAHSMIKDYDDVNEIYEVERSPFFCTLPSETIQKLNIDEIMEEIEEDTIVGNLSFYKPLKEDMYVLGSDVTGANCFGLYAIDPDRQLTGMEKNFIPNIDPEWIVPSEVTRMAHAIQKTSDMKSPIRNLILSGPAGTGKTESTKMLAAELGIPYVNFSCAPDTERMDLTLSVIPNAKTDEENKNSYHVEATDPSDWGFDPEGCYKAITGDEKEGATAMDCLNAVLAEKNDTAGEGFRYVYSNIVKAFKYGWLCEIQEPTIIAKAGVLPSINSMLDKCKSITLMNGETINRHPDCVFCFTTNLDYEGCNPINQSVLSRCIPVNLKPLTEKEAIRRVMSASGYHEQKIIKKMVKVYFKCQEFARNGYITDGAIDMRSLIDWATMNMANGEYYENGLTCLINKCTLDHDLQIEFEGCLKSQFKIGEKASD